MQPSSFSEPNIETEYVRKQVSEDITISTQLTQLNMAPQVILSVLFFHKQYYFSCFYYCVLQRSQWKGKFRTLEEKKIKSFYIYIYIYVSYRQFHKRWFRL